MSTWWYKKRGDNHKWETLENHKKVGNQSKGERFDLSRRASSYFVTEEKMGWLCTHRFVGWCLSLSLSLKEKRKVIDRDQKKIWRWGVIGILEQWGRFEVAMELYIISWQGN